MKEVIVTNKSPKVFKDAFHGVEYIIEPGGKVAMPLAAASHIFGFNLQNKAVAYRRAGFTDKAQGDAFFANFACEYVEYIRKDEAEELEDMKVLLSQKDETIAELTAKLEAAATEIAQLQKKKK